MVLSSAHGGGAPCPSIVVLALGHYHIEIIGIYYLRPSGGFIAAAEIVYISIGRYPGLRLAEFVISIMDNRTTLDGLCIGCVITPWESHDINHLPIVSMFPRLRIGAAGHAGSCPYLVDNIHYHPVNWLNCSYCRDADCRAGHLRGTHKVKEIFITTR